MTRLSLLSFFKIFTYSFDALGPRRGPYFLPLQKVGKGQAAREFSPPCGNSPDQKWGAGRPPFGKPPKSSLALSGLAETPRRFAAGASVAVGEGPRARAPLATAAAPPPLSGWGAGAPLAPPRFPNGDVLPVTRLFLGASPPCPLRFPAGNVLPNHARQRMVPRPENGFCGNALPQISRKPPAAKRLGVSVTPLARIAAEGRASATAEGDFQRGKRLWPALLPTFSAGAEK